MKVLHVVESFAAGVLTSVSQLCNLQVKDGYEVFLAHSVRPETPPNYREGLDPGVQTLRIDLSRQISPYKDLLGLMEIRRIIKKLKPDIIHLHSSKAGFLGRLAVWGALGLNPRVFYSPRGFGFLQLDVSPVKRLLYFVLESIGSLLGGTIIAASVSEAAEAKKLSAKHVVVIENAVDTSIIPIKGVAAAGAVPIKAGTSGRICPQKNPALFRAIAEHFLPCCELQFIWIGGGPDDEKLKTLKNMKLTGWLPRNAALMKLSELDIYIQTSLWEGMPLSVIEAMVSGIPVVASNAVGNRDIVVHNETGFIADTPEEINYFVGLLARDQHLRQAMGREARRQALERFSLKRLQEDINRLYGGLECGLQNLGNS